MKTQNITPAIAAEAKRQGYTLTREYTSKECRYTEVLCYDGYKPFHGHVFTYSILEAIADFNYRGQRQNNHYVLAAVWDKELNND